MADIYDEVMGKPTTTDNPVAAATNSVSLPIDSANPFLPQLSPVQFEKMFGGGSQIDSSPLPTYGPSSRGPAMHAEDISAGGGKGAQIARYAKTFVGTPYVWGGSTPSGFDCSGFVQYVYKKMGVNLPRVSYAQANSGRRVGLNKLRTGDLVAWDNSSRNQGADHIAIYIGSGYIAEAPRPGVALRVRKLGKNEGAWGVQIL